MDTIDGMDKNGLLNGQWTGMDDEQAIQSVSKNKQTAISHAIPSLETTTPIKNFRGCSCGSWLKNGLPVGMLHGLFGSVAFSGFTASAAAPGDFLSIEHDLDFVDRPMHRTLCR